MTRCNTHTCVEKENLKPPKCLFVPSDKMMRIFMKAVAKWGKDDSEHAFLLRFGLVTYEVLTQNLKENEKLKQ